MSGARIRDIAYYLPPRVVTNDDLRRENPDWDIERVEERSGVLSRHVAEPGETALDLSYQACLKLFAANPELRRSVDALLFCTQCEDYIMPPNSCLLHKMLRLRDDVFALDFNLACSGYGYGLALARGLIAAGTARQILLVTADTYSRYIHPGDRSARVLFGDGAAVSWIGQSDGPEEIVDVSCATSGKGSELFMIPAGGCRMPRSADTLVERRDPSGNVRTLENIHMNGMGVLVFVKMKIPKHVRALLDRNNLSFREIDRVVFHQASGMALDWLERTLHLEPGQSFRNLARVGNTVSASIPIAIKDALDQGKIRPKDRVLLVGFGVGLSYASAIVQF